MILKFFATHPGLHIFSIHKKSKNKEKLWKLARNKRKELSNSCAKNTSEAVHEISNNKVCATSKASDQPAHTRSLIRDFASRLSIL